MKVKLGLRRASEVPQEGAGRDAGRGHASGSYGSGPTPQPPPRLPPPPERLWIRAAAFGVDLVVLAGAPLLLATAIVFGTLLATPDPPPSLSLGFRVAQGVFLLLFLLRDAGGASPGKRLLGLRVVSVAGGRVGLWQSFVRNLPLAVPGWNLVEAAMVLRRGRPSRPGDRLAGTTVVEA